MSMPVSQELDKIFEDIDTNFNGYITRDELEAYAKRTNQPESMVDDWFKWFDFGNTGRITYDDLCETLAIPRSKTYTEKVEEKREVVKQEKTIIINDSNKNNYIETGKIVASKDVSKDYAAPQSQPGILDGVKVLYTGPSEPGLLEGAVGFVKSVDETKYEPESKFAVYLKESMERKYGRHWQVIVSRATFGCAIGHEENYFVHFQYGSRLFILYRTTE